MIKKVWCEKYRPKSISEVIFPNPVIEAKFKGFVESGEIPNMLLHGGPGTGKTSISLALVRDLKIQKADVVKVNCSDDKIDAIREIVRNFSMTMPLGHMKIVRLEEVDFLSKPAQGLLRSLLDEVGSTCRFILTCNYVHQLITPLRSRFQEFEIAVPAFDEVLTRSATILDKENVEADPDEFQAVVAAGYPDFRRVIQLLEANTVDGKLVPNATAENSDWKIELLPLLQVSDLRGARKLVCDNATVEELGNIYRFLFDHLDKIKTISNDQNKLDEAVVTLARYQQYHSMAADSEIHVAAMFIELMHL